MSGHTAHDPLVVFKTLIEGNERYVQKHHKDYDSLKGGQAPKVTVLTCGDSRIPQTLFDIESPNELFMVRNIGNQFRNSEGSIKYPLLHLNTPLMIVLGHTGCGAIKASVSDYRGEDDTIQREVVGLVNSIRLAEELRDMKLIKDEGLRLAIYAQTNVDHQVRKIITEYNIKSKVEKKELFVIGMMFDIHGIYGNGSAHTYIVNINGNTNTNELLLHPLVKELRKELAEFKVRRI
jgi:carbonic anhydrase